MIMTNVELENVYNCKSCVYLHWHCECDQLLISDHLGFNGSTSNIKLPCSCMQIVMHANCSNIII